MLAQAVLYLAWMISLAVSQSIDPSTIPVATRGELQFDILALVTRHLILSQTNGAVSKKRRAL